MTYCEFKFFLFEYLALYLLIMQSIYYAMNQGKTVFAQLRSLLPKYEFKITPRCNFHSTG